MQLILTKQIKSTNNKRYVNNFWYRRRKLFAFQIMRFFIICNKYFPLYYIFIENSNKKL